MVDVGDPAPEFALQGVEGDEIREFSLGALTEDTALVLGFYVYDFSPVCEIMMCDIGDLSWLALQEDINVVGVSGDGPYSHMQFIQQHSISYPLLCDTAQEVTHQYGVLNEEVNGFKEVPQRSIFLIGPDQRVHYKWVAEDNRNNWTGEPIEKVRAEFEDLDMPAN